VSAEHEGSLEWVRWLKAHSRLDLHLGKGAGDLPRVMSCGLFDKERYGIGPSMREWLAFNRRPIIEGEKGGL
jgi:hypothetical protein